MPGLKSPSNSRTAPSGPWKSGATCPRRCRVLASTWTVSWQFCAFPTSCIATWSATWVSVPADPERDLNMSVQPVHPRSRFWRRLRTYFRRFRIVVWLLCLTLLAAWIYINQVGLPGPLKRALLEGLHARGVDIEFSRLRVRWYQGIVAENVRLHTGDGVFSPQMTADEVGLDLNGRALARLKTQVDALSLRHGRLVVPIRETNQVARFFIIEDVQSRLSLLPGDTWALEEFRASFM